MNANIVWLNEKSMRRLRIWTVPLALLFFVIVPKAFAHAILVHSTPADQSIVHARNINLTLDYNSRIDASRSVLTLTGPSGNNLPIRIESSTKPSELQATANNLATGAYRIHWQVLASDGHITRGEVAFTVAAN